MNDQNSLVEQLAGFIGLPREVVIKAMTFGGNLLKEPLSELSNIFVDDIRYLRVKNQVKILNKAHDYFEKKGISPKKIPAKVLVPLLEGCSLEEDDSLQKMWEALLINAINPENNEMFISGYSNILNQLSPGEVDLLDKIYTEYYSKTFSFKSYIYNNESAHDISLYKDNFIRLNLVRNLLPDLLHNELENEERDSEMFKGLGDTNYWPVSNTRYWYIEKDTYELTTLGIDFICNCKIRK